MKVLIIEDEKNYGTFLKKVIEKNYECDLISDGRKAKVALSKNRYDIVLHDLRLPGAFGRDLIHWVRTTIDRDIINIVVTGYEHDWTPIEATAEDVFYYLKKGNFTPNDLLTVLNNASQERANRLREKDSVKKLIDTEKRESLGKLAVSVAHEINNPLQSMIFVTELLKRRLLAAKKLNDGGKEIQEEITLLERGIRRIREIVKLLIDFNAIDSDHTERVKLDVLIEKIISFLRPLAKEKGIRINLTTNLNEANYTEVQNAYLHILLYFFIGLIDIARKNLSVYVEDEKREESSPAGIIEVLCDAGRGSTQKSLSSGIFISYGVEVSQELLERYGGRMIVKQDSDRFHAKITVPLQPVMNKGMQAQSPQIPLSK